MISIKQDCLRIGFEGLEMYNFYFYKMQQYMNLVKMPSDNMPVSPKVPVNVKERSPNKAGQVLEIRHQSGDDVWKDFFLGFLITNVCCEVTRSKCGAAQAGEVTVENRAGLLKGADGQMEEGEAVQTSQGKTGNANNGTMVRKLHDTAQRALAELTGSSHEGWSAGGR